MKKDQMLSSCTLEEFTEALIRGNGFGQDMIWLKRYFKDQKFAIVENIMGQYAHNTLQYVMAEFFEQHKKFTKIKETFYDEGGEIAVTHENLEYDLKQYKKIYKQAFVQYQKGESKVAVSINKFSEREITYRVYFGADHEEIMSDWMEYSQKHNFYKGKKIDGDCNFLQLADVKWDDVILAAGTKKVIQENVAEMFEMRELLEINGIPLKGGVILSGPPGVGKTAVCRIMAKEVNATVIYAMPDHLKTIADIRRICEMAKDLAPCMLIIEDIDYIAEDRDRAGNKGAVIELMNYLDGVQEFKDVVTLATTNAVDIIENAVKNRPGRFDRVIKIDNPSEEERYQMFEKFTKNYKSKGPIDLKGMVLKTKGLSGAHIKDLCKTAARQAIRVKSIDENKIAIVKQDHFDAALKEVSNIDYSSYYKAKNTTKKMGFAYDDEDFL